MSVDYELTLMLNEDMKRREFLIFILIVTAVFFIYRSVTSSLVINPDTLEKNELINTHKVSPQELYNRSWEAVKTNYICSDCNFQNWRRWKNRYKGKLKTDEDARVAIETMLASLDDCYTRFLDKKEYAQQYDSIDAHITGIGVNIMSKSGKVIVYSVIEGTPAKKSGIMAGDIFLTVDGKNVNGMDIVKVSELVRGKENSTVTIKLKRKKSTLTKRIVRKKIEIKSVECSVKPNNIGYIKIKSFIGTNTSSDFLNALKKTNNTDGLILDLRGNTGGLLTNAVTISNMFVNDGKIVSIVSKNGKQHDIKAQRDIPTINKPTVVLVDGASASASEILSGALKDNKKAILVGTTTFGKGLVQQIVPLPNETGLNITVAKYLTPNGNDINKKGIKPDYVINYSLKDFELHRDPQLIKAEQLLVKLIHNK